MLEKTKKKEKAVRAFDSCVIEMPREFAIANDLPSRSFVSLTMRKGKLISEIVLYEDSDLKEVDDFLADFPHFDEEMKAIGD